MFLFDCLQVHEDETYDYVIKYLITQNFNNASLTN